MEPLRIGPVDNHRELGPRKQRADRQMPTLAKEFYPCLGVEEGIPVRKKRFDIVEGRAVSAHRVEKRVSVRGLAVEDDGAAAPERTTPGARKMTIFDDF